MLTYLCLCFVSAVPKLEAEKIIPSPSILGYRNKCELTFGVNTKMEEILGFRVSATKNSYATGQGKSTVDHPYDCPNVPRAIKMVAAAFTHFLRDSPFRVYDSFKYTGSFSFIPLCPVCSWHNGLFLDRCLETINIAIW